MRGTERGCGSRGRINDGVVKIRMSGVRGERRYAGSIIKTQAVCNCRAVVFNVDNHTLIIRRFSEWQSVMMPIFSC